MTWPRELERLADKAERLGWGCIDVIENFETDVTIFVLIKPPQKDKHFYAVRPDGTEGFMPAVMYIL